MLIFWDRSLQLLLVTKVNDEYHLFAQKGRFSRLGVYLLHFSIIIIFIGAMIGSFFGYKAFVQIDEGEAASSVTSTSGEPIELGFAVRCDSFSLSFYDTGAPKEYRSVLSVIENGSIVVDQQAVIVNSPLTYRGSPSTSPATARRVTPSFRFAVRNRKSGATTRLTATGNQPVELSEGETLTVLGYVPNFGTYLPGLYRTCRAGADAWGKTSATEPFALLEKYPAFNADKGGAYHISFAGSNQKWRTGLQVTKDPGVRVVWLGCFFLVTGIFVSFFLSHRRIWVRIGGGRIVVAGSASKNQAAFRTSFDDLVEKLKKI